MKPSAKDLITSIRSEINAGQSSVIPTAPANPVAAPAAAPPDPDQAAMAAQHAATLKGVGLGPVEYHPAVGMHLKVL